MPKYSHPCPNQHIIQAGDSDIICRVLSWHSMLPTPWIQTTFLVLSSKPSVLLENYTIVCSLKRLLHSPHPFNMLEFNFHRVWLSHTHDVIASSDHPHEGA